MFDTKEKKIKLTKFLFWKGCIADFFAAILFTYEAISGTGVIMNAENSPAFRYAMGFAASLMWGWTILLFWGTRKPAERSALLLITAFPAIFGIILNLILFLFKEMMPLWIFLIYLIIAYIYGYLKTRSLRE